MVKRKGAYDSDEGVVNSPLHDASLYLTCSTGVSEANSHQARVPGRAPLSKSKRAREGPQDSDATAPEKRGARLRKSCPKNILERVERVKSQRFFMIDRKREGDEPCEEFKVFGSTGNVYTVNVDKLPSCDCPDASRGHHCKHILFIFLKGNSLPRSSELWYQKALLRNELESIFANAPKAPNALAHVTVRETYARVTGAASASASATSDSKRRIPGPEDSCPVCYESMHGNAQNKLVFCEECGNALHTECFGQWRRSAALLTCVWCRAEWPSGAKDGDAASTRSEGYLNLGSAAGFSGGRDTSSCAR
ncbi:hypothetical protein BC827DRAFT_1263339 [Russula dissimulans]|nr:hypothetical protein BC827DRAFT_1263339 [Russula dissimulans]